MSEVHKKAPQLLLRGFPVDHRSELLNFVSSDFAALGDALKIILQPGWECKLNCVSFFFNGFFDVARSRGIEKVKS